MSFSSDVKQELLGTALNPCCEPLFSAALIMFGREYTGQRLSMLTETPAIADAYVSAVQLLSGKTPSVTQSECGNCKVEVDDAGLIDALTAEIRSLSVYQVRDNDDAGLSPCCISSFVRGAFLICGTVTDPNKEYHLEFSCSAASRTAVLAHFLARLGVHVKTTKRSGVNILYLKSSEEIEDLLTEMGASEQAMMMMGAKVYKDIRNTVNRRVNFENANIARSMNAATKQFAAIETIMETGGLESLSPELRECARLRYENIEMTAAEIAKALPDGISVSGVNHRMKRIMRIAEDRAAHTGGQADTDEGQNGEA
ncbi:MAG: DNA-binding protein WhiA [Clostridia bacterium]|nr:DNA-binding protein WhiA [Clostridia bacterium]